MGDAALPPAVRRTVPETQHCRRRGFFRTAQIYRRRCLPRIDWKAYARERGLQVKQFSTPLGEELWLDFANAPDRNLEGKLARMTRWVLDAEAQGMRYGLRMPNGDLPGGTASRIATNVCAGSRCSIWRKDAMSKSLTYGLLLPS